MRKLAAGGAGAADDDDDTGGRGDALGSITAHLPGGETVVMRRGALTFSNVPYSAKVLRGSVEDRVRGCLRNARRAGVPDGARARATLWVGRAASGGAKSRASVVCAGPPHLAWPLTPARARVNRCVRVRSDVRPAQSAPRGSLCLSLGLCLCCARALSQIKALETEVERRQTELDAAERTLASLTVSVARARQTQQEAVAQQRDLQSSLNAAQEALQRGRDQLAAWQAEVQMGCEEQEAAVASAKRLLAQREERIEELRAEVRVDARARERD